VKEIIKRHIGDVVVCRGDPPRGNPYLASLLGEPRVRALRAFKRDGVADGYTFWFAPSRGGARAITRDEVDWEGSAV
jgi:hypothetical protein